MPFLLKIEMDGRKLTSFFVENGNSNKNFAVDLILRLSNSTRFREKGKVNANAKFNLAKINPIKVLEINFVNLTVDER